eukprot:3492283-Alexandrium_andersonii.AAC.1
MGRLGLQGRTFQEGTREDPVATQRGAPCVPCAAASVCPASARRSRRAPCCGRAACGQPAATVLQWRCPLAVCACVCVCVHVWTLLAEGAGSRRADALPAVAPWPGAVGEPREECTCALGLA